MSNTKFGYLLVCYRKSQHVIGYKSCLNWKGSLKRDDGSVVDLLEGEGITFNSQRSLLLGDTSPHPVLFEASAVLG